MLPPPLPCGRSRVWLSLQVLHAYPRGLSRERDKQQWTYTSTSGTNQLCAVTPLPSQHPQRMCPPVWKIAIRFSYVQGKPILGYPTLVFSHFAVRSLARRVFLFPSLCCLSSVISRLPSQCTAAVWLCLSVMSSVISQGRGHQLGRLEPYNLHFAGIRPHMVL